MWKRSTFVTLSGLALLANFGWAALAQTASNPALRDELLAMKKADQELRRQVTEREAAGEKLTPAEVDRIAAGDEKHTARMKEIVAQYGWPGKSLVGAEGAAAAWLLVQHADHDPAFQKKCLALLSKAVAAGEADARDLAYLTDRVRVAAGRPQLYGAQIEMRATGPRPFPIADKANVDKRRAAVGLEPLAEHLKRFKAKPKP